MSQKSWTLVVGACVAAAFVVGIGPVQAHQPVDLGEKEKTPAQGPLLVDGTVSYAVRAEVSRGERRGFRFRLGEGETLAVQYLIVDAAPANTIQASKLPRVTLIDPEGRRTRMIVNERTEFYEPYGGVTYLYLSRVEDEATPGMYRVSVSGRSETPVDAVIAVGYREVRGEVIR